MIRYRVIDIALSDFIGLIINNVTLFTNPEEWFQPTWGKRWCSFSRCCFFLFLAIGIYRRVVHMQTRKKWCVCLNKHSYDGTLYINTSDEGYPAICIMSDNRNEGVDDRKVDRDWHAHRSKVRGSSSDRSDHDAQSRLKTRFFRNCNLEPFIDRIILSISEL